MLNNTLQKSWSFCGNKIQWSVLGHTAVSRCEGVPLFQGLTPSPSSRWCWCLGRTKTDN